MTPAVFSPCRRYRYLLERELFGPLFKPEKPRVCAFVLLNPSTADDTTDDPTIRRCKSFSARWGFDVLRVLNLYALRSTDPAGLWEVGDPVGPDNDAYLVSGTRFADRIVCAWGVNATEEREQHVLKLLREHGRTLHVLKFTSGKRPSHPLYLRDETVPQVWAL